MSQKEISPQNVSAESLLGVGESRDGLLTLLAGVSNYSQSDIQAFIDNPWLTNDQAAQIFGVSRARVSQLASAERIPAHGTSTGRRVYRLHQAPTLAAAASQVPREP